MMWKKLRRIDRLIEEAASSTDQTEVEEARKARMLAEKAQHDIRAQTPEVARLKGSFLGIREQNNFAAYWKSALGGD